MEAVRARARELPGSVEMQTEVVTDMSSWPLVLVRPPERLTDSQMHAYLERFEEDVVSRREPYGIVLDLRSTQSITAAQRQMLTENMAQHERQALCRGTAMVFESRLLRGILTAMFWVRRPSYPTRVFTQVQEGRDWVQSLLRRRVGSTTSRRLAELVKPRASGWVLQSVATREQSEAEELLEALERAGLKVTLHKVERSHMVLYLVRVAGYETRAIALTAARELELAGFEMTVLDAKLAP